MPLQKRDRTAPGMRDIIMLKRNKTKERKRSPDNPVRHTHVPCQFFYFVFHYVPFNAAEPFELPAE